MKVLIAEDDVVSRRMLQVFLTQWGYDVLVAANGLEAWQALQRPDAPRVALLDWMMPGMDGVQICQEVRKRNAQPYIYLLLLTAKGRHEDIIEGLESGADDYLIKPFDPFELRARLRGGRRIVELQEQLISAREALREQATRDPLTGLWNRAPTLEFLRRELARATREHTPLTLAMVDLDHFKAINDAHGHLAGDAVLREVARRLQTAVRTYDVFGRYGGDEFMAVVSRCSAAGAMSIAENFRTRIDRKAVNTSEGLVPITISVGVAACDASPMPPLEAFIRAADSALYRAKASGRNRVDLARPQDFLGTIEALPAAEIPLPSEEAPGSPMPPQP